MDRRGFIQRPHVARLKEFKDSLTRLPGVVSVGLGKDLNGNPVIRVGVDPSIYTPALIPMSFGGMAVEVVSRRPFYSLHAPHVNRVRPLQPGVSCIAAHLADSAGTLGSLIVRDSRTFLISNNHVLAGNVPSAIGQLVFQPAPWEAGASPDSQDNVVGIVKHFHPFTTGINRRDIAIAEVFLPDPVNPIPVDDGQTPLQIYRVPEIGEVVFKSGRTTGLTNGLVFDTDTEITIEFGTATNPMPLRFDDVLLVSGTSSNPFSRGGDSGSFVYDNQMRTAGLLFAGDNANTTVLISPLEVEAYLLEQIGAPPKTLTDLLLSLSELMINVGETRQITATAHYSDFSQTNVTSQATWISHNPGDVSVNAGGRITGVTAGGGAVVTASLGGMTRFINVSVGFGPPPDPVNLLVPALIVGGLVVGGLVAAGRKR